MHLNARYLGVVALGGTIGTGCRELLSLLYPPVDGLPYTILAINVFGALLLGTLLGTLGHRGPDEGRRRIVRLLLGTGVMGGFTTYSSLATDSALLAGDDRFAAAALYSVGTVLIGALGTWMGIAIAAAAHRPQGEGSE
ncbi:MAG: CrcB family protein [Salinibacterium sp.]|nr:MAG: CrcB family protein [Salinibacterium sp.]